MPRPPPDPEVVTAALELVHGGMSYRDAAEVIGVTEGAIRRWAKLAPPSVTPPAVVTLPAHMAPQPVTPLSDLDTGNLLGVVEALIRDQQVLIAEARANGQARAAGQGAATIAKLAILLKQAKELQGDDADTLKIPRAELLVAEATIDARIEALAARGPIRCAECSRALSVQWAIATDADPV